MNPASKVPAIAYGGPPVPPDQPSPESVKLAESLILVEFVADLYPESHLLPADPVKRAQARFFIDVVSNKLVPGWVGLVRTGTPEALQGFVQGIEAVQSLLPKEGFAVGEYSIADVAVTPFLARAFTVLENEIGAYEPGEGKKLLETIQQPQFTRFQKYWTDLQARPSFQATFDKVGYSLFVVCMNTVIDVAQGYVADALRKRFGSVRAKQ